MSLPLDHIVIAVHDLQKAITDYRSLGFTVTPGGDHPGRATHNALVVFQDGSYFELIAWKAPEEVHPWWPKLDRFGPGIVDFALLPSSTPKVVAQALSRGLAYQPPVDGGRLRPDGVELQWQNARPATPDLPFLCGDLTPRALRVPEGGVREHANGVQGVAYLHIAVHDAAASLARYRALLDLQDTAVTHNDAGTASLQLGNTQLKLESASSSRAAAARLAQQGEGPFAIGLYTTQAGPLGAITQGDTHGAHIVLLPQDDSAPRATHTQSVFA
ncbi:VOC family protein [Comamonas guangdongensis]|uniref:VOC family protein n=1 Tax=Comamonas guangdongensis TaxID=510515 RepID=A0ABV4A054_9BURK